MRFDNLRRPPSWITPSLVRQVLDLSASAPSMPAPIEPIQTPQVKPTLRIVPTTHRTESTVAAASVEPPAAEHAWLADESGAARCEVARSRLEPATDFQHQPARVLRANAKFRDWSDHEDRLLRDAYSRGDRIDALAQLLGRPLKGTYSRAHKLGLTAARNIKGGFVTSPKWTPEQDERLREGYGKVPTRELAAELGRGIRAVYQRAFALGLDSGTGMGRPWSGRERLAMRVAFERGIALADVAIALGKKQMTVSRYAIRNGMDFGRRSVLVAPLSIDGLLLLEDAAVAAPTTKRDVYRAREKNNQEASGTARKAPGAASSDVAMRSSARASATPLQTNAASVPAPATTRVVHAVQPSFMQYAEQIASARRYLEARNFSVRRYDRDEILPRWQVSGQFGLLSNEQLVALAVRHGLETAHG